jgi:hypothetical protein
MTSVRLATWLLKRFVTGPHAEAIVGDLLERFNQDASVVWLWRQVLLAMVVSVFQHGRHHDSTTWRVHPKGPLVLAAIVLAVKLAGTMFVVGMLWVLMVAPLFFSFKAIILRRYWNIPRRF